jgi:hypothetical protein
MTDQEQRIRNFLADCHPLAIDLLLEVRKTMLEYLPAHEEHLGWKAVAFYKPNPKASVKDCICYLRTQKNRVILAFPLGVFFSDPHHLMEGNLRYKRHITIRAPEDFDHPGIKDILLQSCAFDSSRKLNKLLPNNDYREIISKI